MKIRAIDLAWLMKTHGWRSQGPHTDMIFNCTFSGDVHSTVMSTRSLKNIRSNKLHILPSFLFYPKVIALRWLCLRNSSKWRWGRLGCTTSSSQVFKKTKIDSPWIPLWAFRIAIKRSSELQFPFFRRYVGEWLGQTQLQQFTAQNCEFSSLRTHVSMQDSEEFVFWKTSPLVYLVMLNVLLPLWASKKTV